MRYPSRRAFTHANLVAIVVVALVGASLAGPGLSGVRRDSRDMQCKANLGLWGAVAGAYSLDNADTIASYSWQAGMSVDDEWIQTPGAALDDQAANQWQQTWILRRLTGRVDGQDRILMNLVTSPQRHHTLLVLADYAVWPIPDSRMACPEDGALLASQADPLNQSLWAGGRAGYFNASQYNAVRVKQRYPFSSTYQPVPDSFAYGLLSATQSSAFGPFESTTHLDMSFSVDNFLGTQTNALVRYPSSKVFFYEFNDRHRSPEQRFYGYAEARCNILFFDGSVFDRRSGDSNPGWDPLDMTDPNEPTSFYTPLTTEPDPVPGEDQNLPVRYRFTRRGLAGIDFPRFAPATGREPRP